MESNLESRIHKTYEDGFKIRSMTAEDVPMVLEWFSLYSEGTCSRELETVLNIHSPGECSHFYIGEYAGEAVASAVSISWGDNIFLDDYYFTKEKYRGRGFSLRLREYIRKHYEDGALVLIDSVQEVTQANREMFGYVQLSETAHYRGRAKQFYETHSRNPRNIFLKTSNICFDDLVAYDNKCFISENNLLRRKFLKEWIQLSDSATCLAYDEHDNVVGYGCRIPEKDVEDHFLVGPLYADDSRIASMILSKLCSDVPGKFIDIITRCSNENAVAMMKDFEFQKMESFDHMYKIHSCNQEYRSSHLKDEVYGVTSLVVCAF